MYGYMSDMSDKYWSVGLMLILLYLKLQFIIFSIDYLEYINLIMKITYATQKLWDFKVFKDGHLSCDRYMPLVGK